MSPYINNALSGVDSFTVALLHMNGTDTSTTFTDETGKAWTANGNAQIDTAQSKFNGASGLFDGTGDYLSASDSDDWLLDGGSNSNTWTVDFWIRFNGDPGAAQVGLIQQRVDNSNYWQLVYSADTLVFAIRAAGVNTVIISNAWNPADATWYHIAVVKNGTTGYMMFVGGSQIGTTQTDTDPMSNIAGTLRIGIHTTSAGVDEALNGWLDEFRISKGIARWTANFTPPTGEY
jgi:hypothetical protein